MRYIVRISAAFLKRSRFLTISCILSIFFADFLCVSMFQLSANAKQKYEEGILEEYGDYQIGLSTEDGRYFTSEEIKKIKELSQVTGYTDGFDRELEGDPDIYALGVKDDAINRSRYKYSFPVKGRKVVVNEYLARKYQAGQGDTFQINGKTFEVGEILQNDSFTDQRECMVIMERDALHKFLGDDSGKCNYMLLQCPDKETSELSSRLEKMSEDFSVFAVKEDETVKKLFKIFQAMIQMLSGIVVLISGMFIVSNFHEYLRKYRRDMAVMRTVGASRKQISLFFSVMSLFLSLIGCGLGMLCTVLLDRCLLSLLNDKLNLFEGNVTIEWGSLLGITGLIFVLFNGIVLIFFICGQNVLPIQVFQETGSHKVSHFRPRMTWLRRIIGTPGYLAVKLALPKLAQNFFIILIIALLTMFSYVGLSFLELLRMNDMFYVKSVTHEADYMADWEKDTQEISFDQVRKYADRIRNEAETACYYQIRINSWGCKNIPDNIRVLYATDLEEYFRINASFYKNKLKGDKTDYIVMTSETMKNKGYHEGDKITLGSGLLKKKKTYVILEAANNFMAGLDTDNQTYMDVNDLSEKEAADPNRGGIEEAFFYIWGYQDSVKTVLEEISRENQQITWLDCRDRMKQADQIFQQRSVMIRLVLGILSLVAGIGWLNSARGMLYSRRKEFQTLRTLGFSERKLYGVAWMQIGIYLLAGIAAGILMGDMAIRNIFRDGVISGSSIQVYWKNVAGITGYLLLLAASLGFTIRDVTKDARLALREMRAKYDL